MALVARTTRLAPVETWPQLLGASQRRFWDGFALATSSEAHALGAVYLLGYVAEMLLKVAYYRIEGYPAYANVLAARQAARRQARLYALHRRSDHDLLYWAALVERRRRERGLPYDPAFAAALQMHVRRVAENWTEALRYADVDATPDELQAVADSVEWLVANRARPWRQPDGSA